MSEKQQTIQLMDDHGFKLGDELQVSPAFGRLRRLMEYVRRPRKIVVVRVDSRTLITIEQQRVTWGEYFREIGRILIDNTVFSIRRR